MDNAIQGFVNQTDRLAKKYNAKVSIGVPGEEEVVIADHRPEEEEKVKLSDDSTILLSLEEMIRSNVKSIADLKEEKKNKAEMLKDSYLSDAIYHNLDEKAKDARREATALKAQISQLPANKTMAADVRELGQEIKERQLALSDYLLEYKRISGATQLELFPGEFGEIVLSARLIKARKN